MPRHNHIRVTQEPEDHKSARGVLNRARRALPTDAQIWITGAQLEEAHGNTALVDRMIEKGLRSLQEHGAVIDRDAWLRDAETAERGGSPVTCRAIVRHTVSIGVEGCTRPPCVSCSRRSSLFRV